MSRIRNGQLKPLEERMSVHNQEKRAAKVAARQSVAQALAVDAYQTRALLRMFATMGFWARLGWILYGRLPQPPKTTPNLTVRTVKDGE